MAKYFSICLLIVLATFSNCNGRPQKKVYDPAVEMEVEEDVSIVEESANEEQVIPAPLETSVDTEPEGDGVAIVLPTNKMRTGKYTLHTQERPWAEANEYCRNDNQHLVRLETSLELRTVLAHFAEGVTRVWTDGIGDLKGKKYVWATTGDKVDIVELEHPKANEDVFPNALVLEREGLIGEIQLSPLPFICET